jgi:hypothetical protein
MSLSQIGQDTKYIYPASYDAVPEAWKSNKSAKPVSCSIQTVNIPSLTGNATQSGTSVIQVPCGSSAGYITNPYLRFTFTATGGGAPAANLAVFKGASKCATALINRLSTFVNSVQVDNIQNADQVYDQLFSHSTSNDWITRDATLLLGSNVEHAVDGTVSYTYVVPLLGVLGAQQAFPAFLVNGVLQISIDFNSVARALASGANPNNATGFTISSVQFCYDKVMPDSSFIDKVRADMMMGGSKYVYSFTNYQSTTIATQAGQQSINYGLNVSSLRGLVASQVATADLTSLTAQGYSVNNTLSQFQVTLDGRLQNNLVLDSVNATAVCFAEMNKALGRIFDASITDIVLRNPAFAGANTYLTQAFLVGISAQRCNEALAFSGSPVSVVGVQPTLGATACTMFITFISDMQLVISPAGDVEILR